MRLMLLTEFRVTHLAGDHRPQLRTLRRWPAARKIGGQWFIDLDELAVASAAAALVETLDRDPAIARLASGE